MPNKQPYGDNLSVQYKIMSKTAERLMMAQKAALQSLAASDCDAKQRLADLRASYEHQLLKNSQQIEELELQVAELKTEIHQMRSEQDSLLESGFVALGDSQEIRVVTPRPLKDPNTQQKVKSKTETEPAPKSLPSLQSRLQEILSENQALAASLSKALSKINSLTVDVAALRQANDRLETEINSHKLMFAEYDQQLAQTRKVCLQMVPTNQHEVEAQAYPEEIARLKQQISCLQKQQASLKDSYQRCQQEAELNIGIARTEKELAAIQTLQIEILKAKAMRPEESTQLRLQVQKAEEQNKQAREQYHQEISILNDRINDLEENQRLNAERYEHKVRQLEDQVTDYKAKLEQAIKPREIMYYLEQLFTLYKNQYGPTTDLQRLKRKLLDAIDKLIQKHKGIHRPREEGSQILRR